MENPIQFKIKYKLIGKIPKNIQVNIYDNLYQIECTKEYLNDKYGIPFTNQNLLIWNAKVKSSDNHEFIIQFVNEINSTQFKIMGPIHESLDYTKLIGLIDFENKNFVKKQNKEIKRKEKSDEKLLAKTIKNEKYKSSIKNNQDKYTNIQKIDESKYRQIDIDRLSDLTDDDLVSILFTRFVKTNKILTKQILELHSCLTNPNVVKINNECKKYNNSIERITSIVPSRNFNKDKTKYNNKR